MVMFRAARIALAVLATAPVLQLQLARAATPEYKLGDVAVADVVTPVDLVVVNPEATEQLKKRVADEVRFVVRHAPQAIVEVEADLRATVLRVRRNFMTNLQQADFDSPGFDRVIREIKASTPRDFPFDKFALLWTRGQPDDAILENILQPIREVLAQPIVNNKTDAPLPTNQPVRLVPVQDLNRAPNPTELDHPGVMVQAGKVLSLWRAKRLVETYFPSGQEAMGRFASAFMRFNAVPDPATTELLRIKRMDGVAVNDSYPAAETIVRKGQTIDRKALNALAMMREKSMIGVLQSKLEQEQTVAVQIQSQTKLIGAVLGVVCVVLVMILWRLRARPSTALVTIPTQPALPGPEANALASAGNDASWRSRALIAEDKAARAQQAIRSGAMGWMREKVFRTLSHQRAELLDVQQKAEAEMRELEQRLEQLHAPLQERITAYERRIEELEKDLAAKGEENRELIGARINVARQHLSMERERRRFGIN